MPRSWGALISTQSPRSAQASCARCLPPAPVLAHGRQPPDVHVVYPTPGTAEHLLCFGGRAGRCRWEHKELREPTMERGGKAQHLEQEHGKVLHAPDRCGITPSRASSMQDASLHINSLSPPNNAEGGREDQSLDLHSLFSTALGQRATSMVYADCIH